MIEVRSELLLLLWLVGLRGQVEWLELGRVLLHLVLGMRDSRWVQLQYIECSFSQFHLFPIEESHAEPSIRVSGEGDDLTRGVAVGSQLRMDELRTTHLHTRTNHEHALEHSRGGLLGGCGRRSGGGRSSEVRNG